MLVSLNFVRFELRGSLEQVELPTQADIFLEAAIPVLQCHDARIIC